MAPPEVMAAEAFEQSEPLKQLEFTEAAASSAVFIYVSNERCKKQMPRRLIALCVEVAFAWASKENSVIALRVKVK